MKNKPFAPQRQGISLKKGNFKKKLPFFKGRSQFIDRGVLLLILILFLSIIYHRQSTITLAQTFNSTNYEIQFGNFNMTSGKKNSPSYTLTDTVGQNAPGRFTNSGYVVKSGFQYIYDTSEKFSFNINEVDLPFGSMTPNVGSTQTNIITITSPSSRGYEVLAIANHPLLANNYTIPDTSCNSNNCSKTTSAPWTISTAYGFGFNALGINSSGVATNIGTSNYFTDTTYYRPFASLSKNDLPQVFMSENNRVKDRQARITYKVNISPNQATGVYSNLINLIAIPKY
ncbi:MAG: hypothetical protein PHX84_04035 [Candidatus Shapirobacteria bacterium]|jgi:hypothetical protein|nr:hypothetical protein [Candidatus Shapirobacteria bacterium]